MDKILLIDGHNAMWRASVTFGDTKMKHQLVQADERDCSCGQPWDFETKSCSKDFIVIFNFFRNLRPIIELFSPDKCFFVLEGHPQFRYDLFADYKANRIIKQASKKEVQAKFFKDKDVIVSLLQHLPITTVRASSYEADDVIATLCDDLKEEAVTVLSNDSDYIQLLQRGYKSCQVYNPIKKVFMEAPAYPYVPWKCLNGDKSDNIPALLKPKKALDTVNSPDMFRKFLEVEENRANFSINRQLIEFRSIPLEEIVMHEGVKNFELLKQEFAKMEFESIINDKSWAKYKNTFDCIRY